MEKKEVKALCFNLFFMGMAEEYCAWHWGVGKKITLATVIAANLSLKMELNDLEKSNYGEEIL